MLDRLQEAQLVLEKKITNTLTVSDAKGATMLSIGPWIHFQEAQSILEKA